MMQESAFFASRRSTGFCAKESGPNMTARAIALIKKPKKIRPEKTSE